MFGLVASLFTGARVLKEYERAVIFRMGRARKRLAGPGLTLLLPFGIDRPRVIDTRTKAIQIPPQDVITRDNISISVDAVVYATVASPQHAILEVEEYWPATLQLAATTLRAVLGKMELDDILAHRDAINNEVRGILDTRTEQWGVEISAVEIKDIQLPKEMQRAMARQAEAERERRAKVIAAEGEVQAAEKLAQAAAMIAQHPGALQLRLYQTLVEVSGEASSTIVFPVPIDLTGGMAQPGASASSPQAHAGDDAVGDGAGGAGGGPGAARGGPRHERPRLRRPWASANRRKLRCGVADKGRPEGSSLQSAGGMAGSEGIVGTRSTSRKRPTSSLSWPSSMSSMVCPSAQMSCRRARRSLTKAASCRRAGIAGRAGACPAWRLAASTSSTAVVISRRSRSSSTREIIFQKSVSAV